MKNKFESNSVYSTDIFVFRIGFFYFFSEIAYMYIDSIVFPILASVPDEIVQHFAGIDLLWIFYEKIE